MRGRGHGRLAGGGGVDGAARRVVRLPRRRGRRVASSVGPPGSPRMVSGDPIPPILRSPLALLPRPGPRGAFEFLLADAKGLRERERVLVLLVPRAGPGVHGDAEVHLDVLARSPILRRGGPRLELESFLEVTRAEFGSLGGLRGAYRVLARSACLALHGFDAFGLALARAEGLEELSLLLLSSESGHGIGSQTDFSGR